jgi:hypothetical protein
MGNQQKRQLTQKLFKDFLKEIGYDIADERLDRVVNQTNAILQNVDQLDHQVLQTTDPANVFWIPSEHNS